MQRAKKINMFQTDVFMEFPWLQVFVAGLAFFAFGALWYSKLLFAKPWIKLAGIDINHPDTKKGVGVIMGGSLVMMLIASFALGVLVSRLEISGFMSGLKLGLLTGVCFAATGISISFIYEKRPLGLHLIDGLYMICGHVIVAVILCTWQ